MDKKIEYALLEVERKTHGLVQHALHTERLEREDWDKVNELFGVFAEDIKKGWERQSKVTSNYDVIKNSSVDDMATILMAYQLFRCSEDDIGNKERILEWLLEEH